MPTIRSTGPRAREAGENADDRGRAVQGGEERRRDGAVELRVHGLRRRGRRRRRRRRGGRRRETRRGDDGDDGDGDATTHPSPYRDASAPERARGEDGEVSPRDERGEAERGAPQRGRARGVALDGDDDSLLRVVVEDLARRARLRMRRRTRRRSAARGRHRAAGCASRAGEDATRSTREGGRDEARARAKANAREDGSVVIAYSSRSSHKSFSPTPSLSTFDRAVFQLTDELLMRKGTRIFR